jgi:outer membrane protein OmpA-like peptidoglycan-associated protein
MKREITILLAIVSIFLLVSCASTGGSTKTTLEGNGYVANESGLTTQELTDVVSDHEDFKVYVNTQLYNLRNRTENLEARVSANTNKLSKLQRLIAETTDSHDFITPTHIYLWTSNFKTGKSDLTEDQKKELDAVVSDIKDTHITFEISPIVEGFADTRGNKDKNVDLSRARAQAAIDYMVEKLGAEEEVPWEPGTKWKEYFGAKANGPTSDYGKYEDNRRIRLTQVNK